MGEARLDEIGYWSEVKLDIVRKYAQAYSKVITGKSTIKRHIYIDGFSGPGVHISKQTKDFVLGSPLNALNVEPPFNEYHFIDLDKDKTNNLRQLTKTYQNVYVYNDDCNKLLIEKIFPRAKYSDFHRALCLLDPYKLDLNWEVLRKAGEMESIEIFLNFPVMDMNRNVLLRKNPDKVKHTQIARMDAFWGDRTWHDDAYTQTQGLWDVLEDKVSNVTFAKAFQKRLKEIAGFSYVPDPIPMINSTGSIIYYLFFASPNKVGAKIVKDIFNKYRNRSIA